MSEQESPQRPVNDEDINQHIDRLFEGKTSKENYPAVKQTLKQAIENGLDYSQGNPLQRSLSYLSQLLDRKIADLKAKGMIPKSISSTDLEEWGQKVEEWGERVNARHGKKGKSR